MTSCFTHFTVAVSSALIHIAAETINHFKLTPFSNAKKKKKATGILLRIIQQILPRTKCDLQRVGCERKENTCCSQVSWLITFYSLKMMWWLQSQMSAL